MCIPLFTCEQKSVNVLLFSPLFFYFKVAMSFESEQVAVVQSLLAMASSPPQSSASLMVAAPQKYVAIPSAWWKAWLRRSRSFSLTRLTGLGLKKLAPKPGPIPPPPLPGDSPVNDNDPVYVVPYSVYCTLVDWHGATSSCVPFTTDAPTPHQVLLADEAPEEVVEGAKDCSEPKQKCIATSDTQIIVETNVETKKVVSKPKKGKKKKGGKKCSKKCSCDSSCVKVGDGADEKSINKEEEEEERKDGDKGGEKIDLVCQTSISSFKEEDQFVLCVSTSSTLLELRKKLYPVLVKRRKELEGNFENTVVMGKRFWDPPVMWENLEDEDYELNLPASYSGEKRSATSTLEEAGVDDTFRVTLAVIPEKRKSEMRIKHEEEAQRRQREDEEFERKCKLGALFMPASSYAAPSHTPHCRNFNGNSKDLCELDKK